jgi:hypothetical protein
MKTGEEEGLWLSKMGRHPKTGFYAEVRMKECCVLFIYLNKSLANVQSDRCFRVVLGLIHLKRMPEFHFRRCRRRVLSSHRSAGNR